MKPQTSFIPHDAGDAVRPRHGGGAGLIDLMALLAMVLFIASAALGVAVFLYKQFLQASSASKVEQITRATEAFQPELIREITRLDDRMRVAGEILNRHVALSAFFRMLEATTVSAIGFRSLTFESSDGERMNIKMDGIAESMNAIALQADLFSKVGMVTSPIFSNIDRRADGVHFSFTAILNPSSLNFAALVRGIVAPVPEQVPTAPVVEEAPVSPFDAPPAEPTSGAGEPGATE